MIAETAPARHRDYPLGAVRRRDLPGEGEHVAGVARHAQADRDGPDAVVRAVSIRLGVPCHAGDTLTLSGHARGEVVSVTGRCSLGDHVTATVRIEVPR